MRPMSTLDQPASLPLNDPVRRAVVGPWLIELLPASAYEARYVATHSSIGFAFDSQRGVHAIGSDRVRPFDALPNGLAFVPAGCDVYSQSSKGGEYLRVLRPDGWALNDERPFNNRIDPQAIRLAQRMRNALLKPASDDDWELWAMTLASRVCAEAESAGSGSITPRRLRLLDEYLDAGLSEPISVQAMAALLDLSEGYFMRAFTEATGTSPHRYLIDRRIARARSLLRDPAQRLADIAHACGFSSQAHMTTTFTQRLGVSPGVFRR
ncbi:AraC family transcriptional regulator [Pseudomonas sp. RC10]|uniref:helix-turn-helix transcriptional regulator n=1 Tax=Pseudomonas bambusae TaxID=3139142 RepID=UPI00313958B5